MVIWAPVEFGELSRAYLEAMVAKGPLVKGVRRGLGNDPAVATSADFVRGCSSWASTACRSTCWGGASR